MISTKVNPATETNRYAVILAGGDGTRLRSLTRAISGDERPKQFCPLIDDLPLLEITRRRVARSIPESNIAYSLNAKHGRYFEPLLAAVPNRLLHVQPENKGTAPAILFSLMKLAADDPDAVVAFFPSDHYFSDDEAFMAKVDRAFESVEVDPASVVLIGIEPDSAETSYGWIEPHESLFGGLADSVTRVRRFWEKPPFRTAVDLMLRGCLWNSFVMVGRVSTLLGMIAESVPDLYRIFESARSSFGTSLEAATMRSVYAWINEVNFSSEVLERSADRLYVMRVGDVIWNDLGEPQRVIGTLNAIGIKTDWAIAA